MSRADDIIYDVTYSIFLDELPAIVLMDLHIRTRSFRINNW